jgi:dynein heavy chain, axonemal
MMLLQVEDENLVHIFRTILDWHISTGAFPNQIKACAPAVINATLEMYTAAAAKLLPTPTKSHYVFNLRDFARVIQGMMMLPKAALPEDTTQVLPPLAPIPQTLYQNVCCE